jgi:integrase
MRCVVREGGGRLEQHSGRGPSGRKPLGNELSSRHELPPSKPLTVGAYAAETWLPRKVPPLVRASLAQTYRKHLRTHILPVFGETRLDAITVSALEVFRMGLIDKVAGKGLAVKTARDMIDGSFRALFRDARKEELVTGDPFAALDWPDKVDPEPDPFTEEERDILLDYYWRKDRHWFPFVFTQFFTGLRPGEAIGLRRGGLDLRRGRLSVRVSRTLGEDNPPKTKKSKRTITVRPEVVVVLRDMPQPLHLSADDFVFTTATGRPVDEERFVQQHWHRALRATAIRPRKFYATRHTFISASLEAAYNIKRLADYCGTSVEMIERHYAGYLRDETPEEILRLGGQPSAPTNTPHHTPSPPAPSVKTGTLPGTFRGARRSSRQVANAIGELVTEGGRFEPAQGRGRLIRSDVRKRLGPKGLARSQASAAAPRNDPEKPRTTRQNPDRSGFRDGWGGRATSEVLRLLLRPRLASSALWAPVGMAAHSPQVVARPRPGRQ